MRAVLLTRGFGIEAMTAPAVVRQVAQAAEAVGYGSFWLNGSPPDASLRLLAEAAAATSLPLGIGVLPLTRRPIEDVLSDLRELDLPLERIWLGIGYGAPSGALDYIRRSVTLLHEAGARVLVGAVGPRMTELAGEIGDGVSFTWWFKDAIEESRPLVERGAAQAGRPTPPIMSYIRCALLPQAETSLSEQAANYDSIPSFAAMFARHGISARDAVVTGPDAAALQPGIAREEAVLDFPVIRAVTADRSAPALLELLEACRPPIER
jgi:alkanesulfonate monooxygenase SsuD/methylene tetrahydromethanopterin reductase-like flavin-dependent oxidoreductase (luciferase family)